MELLEAVRGGDTAAFGTLYRRHSVAARSLARRIAQSEDAVEDLLAETFARVLEVVRRGDGPASAFRPYLLGSLRRYAATGVVDLADGDSLYVDPELAGLERSPLARAYRSLPERWRALLWHVEIEGGGPADAGPLVGLSGRAAADLTRRARRGLREAYVRLHLEDGPRAECRPIVSMILRYLESGLPKGEAAAVDAHVAECIDCRSVFLQLVDLTQELRAVVGQLVAGPAVDDYLADLATATTARSRSYGGARARLEAARQHVRMVKSRADRRMRRVLRAARDRPAGRAHALLREAYGRARTTARRLYGKAGALPGAAYGGTRTTIRRVYGKAGALPRAAYVRVRAALARLSALVRSMPTPHRAVLGGIAVAGLATAAFLLVAQPMETLSAGRSGERALDRPRPADGAASSRTAAGDTESAGTPFPYDRPRPHPWTSGSAADQPGAGIALGMPEITGRAGPGTDRRSPREETTGTPPASGHAGEDRPGREGGEHAAADADGGGRANRRPASGRPVGEPRTVTALPRREQGSGHADAARGPVPERQRVRGQLSRHPYQEHPEQARAQAGTRAEAQGGARAGSRQEPGATRDRREPQARNAATRRAPLARPGGSQAGERARSTGRSDTGAQKTAGSLGKAKGAGSPGKAKGAGSPGKAKGAGSPGKAKGAGSPGKAKGAGSPGKAKGAGSPGKAKGAGSPGKAKEALAVAVDPLGALLRGQPGLVAVRLRNAGDAATGDVTATVTLPPGVRYLDQDGRGGRGHEAKPGALGQNHPRQDGVREDGAASDSADQERAAGRGADRAQNEAMRNDVRRNGVREDGAARDSADQDRAAGRGAGDARTRSGAGDGWSCEASGRLVRCARGPLAAGEVTAIFLKVAVAADAPTGRAFTVRVRAGRLESTAQSTVGVRASGAAARFAADGRLAARVVGNVLVGSAASSGPCGAASGGRGRSPGVSVPVDLDRDPSTGTSSCADLDLPAGGHVLWAGLYWAGGGRGAVPAQDIRVRAPGRPGYATLHAAEVARRDLPSGSGYQAFAEVTSLVRAAGGGRWWVAGAPARAGTVRHSAWGLVVMVADVRQPYTRAVVLDAAAVIGNEERALRLPLDGLAPDGAPARIDLMVWNGEGVRAGVVTMGDREDRRGSGVLGRADPGGVAVDTLHALLGPHPALQLATRRDPVFFGVAVVSARTWS
ncbi:sigma factor [Microbispora sp. H10836]|uniref:sigma factor n=1 Tax=Microbispora sp. H10836 TaxID=2729106 RepID=UPI001473F823|nr:sigma factor [Microbispora sp. H10836]